MNDPTTCPLRSTSRKTVSHGNVRRFWNANEVVQQRPRPNIDHLRLAFISIPVMKRDRGGGGVVASLQSFVFPIARVFLFYDFILVFHASLGARDGGGGCRRFWPLLLP